MLVLLNVGTVQLVKDANVGVQETIDFLLIPRERSWIGKGEEGKLKELEERKTNKKGKRINERHSELHWVISANTYAKDIT